MSQEEMRQCGMTNEQMTNRGLKGERGEMKEERVAQFDTPAQNAASNGEPKSRARKPEAWDQMEGEPLSHYTRFLVYRDLGSTRTLRKAWALVKGKNWRAVSDNNCKYWRDLSARWKWVRRAQEWDKAMLSGLGDETIVQFVGGLKQAASEVNQALERVKPKTWREAMEGLNLVGSFIDPQSIKAVAGHGESGDSEEEEEEEED